MLAMKARPLSFKRRRIPTPSGSLFNSFWRLYLASFPKNERRGIEEQRKMLANPNYRLEAVMVDGTFAGFVSRWSLSGFAFVEHFAIAKRLRNHGLGHAVFAKLIKQAGRRMLVIEVEPAKKSAAAKSRIAFYERLGFKLNSFPYLQPAYRNKSAIRLLFMSLPKKLSKKEFAAARKIIHTKAYGLPKPLLG